MAEETGVPVASHCQTLSHNVVPSTPLHGPGPTTIRSRRRRPLKDVPKTE